MMLRQKTALMNHRCWPIFQSFSVYIKVKVIPKFCSLYATDSSVNSQATFKQAK